jgi:hypothetical protein
MNTSPRPHARLRRLLALTLAAAAALTPAHASFAAATALACPSPSFTQPPVYPVGSEPRSLAVADFDADGRPDVVAANYGSDSVTVLRKVARAMPAAVTGYAVGRGPSAVAAADLNGDGAPDIVTANNSSSNVTVLLGDGTGGFRRVGDFPSGASPRSVAVGDFNGDGRADLAVAAEFSFGVAVLLGDGQGGFGLPTVFQAGQQPHFAAAADLNADGRLDLIVSIIGFVQILLGDGDGHFTRVTTPCAQAPADSVEVGDVNRDGKPDLVAANLLGSQIHVLLGTGTGCFAAPINLEMPVDFRPSRIALGDLDGDGKLDINATGLVLLGDGAGGFGPVKNYRFAGSVPALADFDGDGRLDVVYLGDHVHIRLGDGAGGFKLSLGQGAAGDALARADFNGDGRADLAAGTLGGVSVVLGDGAGSFGPPTIFPTRFPVALAAADFNRDGKMDVAALDPSNGEGGFQHVLVLPGDGAGALGTPVETRAAVNVQPAGLASGDFNHDGNPDLLTINRSGGPNNGGSVSVLLGVGNGTFLAPSTIGVRTAVNPKAVGVTDVNGDGKTDVVMPGDGSFSVLLGNGAGGFAQPASIFTANASTLTVADFNGDGKIDVAGVSLDTPKVSVALGDGAGGFGATQKFDTGASPQDVAAADFNGDGKTDLAVWSGGLTFGATRTLPDISILYGDGAGGFAPAVRLATGSFAGRFIADDFNGDGAPDIVGNSGPNGLYVLLNFCGEPATQPTLRFSAPSYTVGEGAGGLTVTVVRDGPTSGEASVRYATSDGSASSRSDYITAVGTLRFAPGETEKTFRLLVVDDARPIEGNESLDIKLSDAVGAGLGVTASAVVSIQENDASVTPLNPVDGSAFFVRQHYLDFLARDPDAEGLAFWIGEIEGCGANAQCREVKRINVSAAFFLSIEFQETGYLAYRAHKAAYGDATSPNVAGTVPVIRLMEFLADARRISEGVVVNVGDWRERLEANKNDYAAEFVQRPRFLQAFPTTLTAEQFVDKLNQNAGGVLSQVERDQLVAGLASAPAAAQVRANALRQVADHERLRAAELNRAFVLMQFYGYLRRNPDDPQDTDFRGWKFWLDKLNEFGGDYVAAEMVKAFINSDEYRRRFNTPNGF